MKTPPYTPACYGSKIRERNFTSLGPIVVGVIIAAGGIVIIIIVIVVVAGIEWAADVVDLALSPRNLHLVARRAIFAGFHREHLHLLLEAKLLRHRANLRILLLLLLLLQSFLSRIPGAKAFNRLLHVGRIAWGLWSFSQILLKHLLNLLIHLLSPNHSRSSASK